MRFPQLRSWRTAQGRSFKTLAGFAFATASACAGSPEPPVVYDFVTEFAVAAPLVEMDTIDFGKPAARSVMLERWYSLDERWAQQTPFVWGLGPRSTIELPLVKARPLTLVLECQPFPRGLLRRDVDVPTQSITVVVNGWTAGSVLLSEGFASYEIAVPQDVLAPGRNLVEFQYAYSPGDAGFRVEYAPVDRTVAWASVQIGETLSLEAPRHGERDGVLELPFNTGIAYHTHIPAGTSLSLDRLTTWGNVSEGDYLEVGFTDDASDTRSTVQVTPSSWRAPSAIAIPQSAWDQLVRLSFTAYSGSGGVLNGGLSLSGPALTSQAAPDPSQAPESPATLRADRERPNVLIYLIDTLRPDRLGAYGYPLDTSPRIDALARDGILFTNSIAQSSWTRASIASIFTGVHPRSHGVNGRTDELSSEALTMAALLDASGYQTAGFVTNGNVSPNFGFDHGFETYVHLRERRTTEIHVLSDALNEQAFAWLDSRDNERPFFLYLHATDPHDPYTPRSPFRERYVETREYPDVIAPRQLFDRTLTDHEATTISSELGTLYDAEVAFTDHHFGQLVDSLKKRELYDSTAILLVSDHGEAFFEHGDWGHGNSLYQEQLAVPLVIKLPGQVGAGQRVEALAQHVDLLPTILDLLGVPVPTHIQGNSLLSAGRVGTRASASGVSYLNLDGREMDSFVAPQGKLIRYLASEQAAYQFELFDLATDPSEWQSLTQSRGVLRGYLLSSLKKAVLNHPTLLVAGEAILDEELEERLRTLGCLR